MRIKATILSLLVSLCALAQVTVKLQCPQQVPTGQRFNVRYEVNSTDVEDFKVGDFQGLEVLYGPSTSRQSSYNFVNGHASSSSTMTFTYTVVARQAGKASVPAATVVVGGKSYQSRTGSIEVVEGDDDSAQSSGGQHGNAQQPQQTSRPSQSGLSAQDIYISATASKTKVYEQEAVMLTYKLYTLVNVQQIAGEMPKLDGCHVEELPSKQQMEVSYERVNGRTYRSAVWRQYLIYPQKAGKITIPQVKFETQVVVQNTSMDPFDIFFGGGSLQQVIRYEIMTKPTTIEVTALPEPRPASFSGAVGSFTLSSSLTPQELKANDAATLRLVVSGQGNMKLMKAPNVVFPKDFEVYTPKSDDKTSLAVGGHKGNMVYDYVVVPRHGGAFDIDPVEFCYFDPSTRSYKTLSTEAYHVEVEKAKGIDHTTSVDQEDVQVIAHDIRFIHRLGNLKDGGQTHFFASLRYWMSYLCVLLLCLAIIAIFYRQAKENANVARQRSKKAGKAATKRLKAAAKLLKTNQTDAFWDELMRALLGYAADKLNIPTSELNKDNVREKLQAANVSEEVIEAYLQVLSDAEFARFAPGDPNAMKEKLFTAAQEAINNLENK